MPGVFPTMFPFGGTQVRALDSACVDLPRCWHAVSCHLYRLEVGPLVCRSNWVFWWSSSLEVFLECQHKLWLNRWLWFLLLIDLYIPACLIMKYPLSKFLVTHFTLCCNRKVVDSTGWITTNVVGLSSTNARVFCRLTCCLPLIYNLRTLSEWGYHSRFREVALTLKRSFLQATRHARRVYVGGLPPMANEQVSKYFGGNCWHSCCFCWSI